MIDSLPILRRFIQAYGVAAEKQQSGNGSPNCTINHTTFVYVIDRASQWRDLFAYDAAIDDIASHVRYLVHQ